MEEELRKLLTERDNLTRRVQRQEYFMNRQLEDMENDFKSYMPSPTSDQEKQFKQLKDEYKESAEKEIDETKEQLNTIEGNIGTELSKIRDELVRKDELLKKNIDDAKKNLEDATRAFDEAEVRKIRSFRYDGVAIDDNQEFEAKEAAQAALDKAQQARQDNDLIIKRINQFYVTISVKDTPSDKILEMLGFKEVEEAEKTEEPAVEKEAEPAAEPAKPEPVVEPKAELAAEPVKPEPVVEPKAEPAAEPAKPEPVVEPKAEPAAEPEKPEPVVEPKVEPAAEPEKPEPVVEPKVEPAAEPEKTEAYYEELLAELLKKGKVEPEKPEPVEEPKVEPKESGRIFFSDETLNLDDVNAEPEITPLKPEPVVEPEAKPAARPIKIKRVSPKGKTVAEPNIELVSVETDLSQGCVSCIYNIDGKEVVIPTQYVDEEHESVYKPKELIESYAEENEPYIEGTDPYVLYAIYESARGLNVDGYIDEDRIKTIQTYAINQYNQALKVTEKNNLSKLQIVYGKSDTTCDKNMLKYEKKYIRRAKISSMVDCSEVKDDIKTIFEKAKDFFTGITNKASKLLGGEKKLGLSEGEKQEEHSMTDDERIQKMKEKMNVYSKEEYSKKVSETQEILSKKPNARDVASKTAQSIASRMKDDEGR